MKVKVNQKAYMMAMIDSGLNVEELCKKSGVSKQALWNITACNKGTKPDTLYRIGKALGVKPSSLAAIDDGE